MIISDTHQKDSITPILEIKDLVKTYQTGDVKVHALNGISFKIYPGEFIALMGTSGSGKTTLLNLIGGLDGITSGSIVLGGVNLAQMKDKQLTKIRRTMLGFVFQFFNLIPVLTAYENVELPLKILKVPKEERKKKVTKLFKELGLEDRLNNKPDQLSGGQQQRVAIARALILNPAIILADEPTGNLDSETSKNVMNSLAKLNQEYKKTIIMVTHDKSIANYSSKIFHMNDGLIVKEENIN